MNSRSDSTEVEETLQIDGLPDGLTSGSTVLVASASNPSRNAVCLQLLRAHGAAEDTALVVTTTESADRTIERFNDTDSEITRPTLGIVDTASEQQSVSALHGETPVVFTPSPGDLERLVLALSDLSGTRPPSNGARHLVVRSLTPILAGASTAGVRTVLERITGLRSEIGLCLVGIDYTAHDEETMTSIADQMDGILWVTRPDPDRLAFDYRATRGQHSQAVPSDREGVGSDDS